MQCCLGRDGRDGIPGPPGPAGNSKIGLIFALLVLYSIGIGRVGGGKTMHPLLAS